MTELTSTLSLEDVYDLLEVATVDAHNTRILHERAERKASMS